MKSKFGDGKMGIPDVENLDIGFLVYTKEAHVMKHLKVGTKLKNPSCPIWLICSNDNWGVLFSPNIDLLEQFTKEYGLLLLTQNDLKCSGLQCITIVPVGTQTMRGEKHWSRWMPGRPFWAWRWTTSMKTLPLRVMRKLIFLSWQFRQCKIHFHLKR